MSKVPYAIVAAVLVVAAVTAPRTASPVAQPAIAVAGAPTALYSGAQPNIVVILTDDQRYDDLSHMTTVNRELGGASETRRRR